ncbi:hypothetical protein [Streptomyces sp. NPDC005799]|uniref:hypothetical protein n=1 Tax=Streptomyces sp. NPDC005799 TaxID=3154678 RepID=UPI0033FC5A54
MAASEEEERRPGARVVDEVQSPQRVAGRQDERGYVFLGTAGAAAPVIRLRS